MKVAGTHYDRVHAAAEAAAAHLDVGNATVGMVLGSGLGSVADRLANLRAAPYASLPGFPETTVAGHPGRLVCGELGGRQILGLCGRVHAYEGYAPAEVVFGVRVLAALGVRTVVVTNASGGVDPALKPGEIVAISDHLNLTGATPLAGHNDERIGPRFVDMTDVYTPSLRALASEVAQDLWQRRLREAVYAGMAGPSYETPAEVRMLRVMGAGIVGMSTVHEVIAARHAGLDVLGLALVANPAAGVADQPLKHEDVTAAAGAGAGHMAQLVAGVLQKLSA